MIQPQRTNRPAIMIITGIALVVLTVALIVGLSGGSRADATDYALASSSAEAAPRVSQLAADAAKAADEVNLEAGLALMCAPPPTDDLSDLKKLQGSRQVAHRELRHQTHRFLIALAAHRVLLQ